MPPLLFLDAPNDSQRNVVLPKFQFYQLHYIVPNKVQMINVKLFQQQNNLHQYLLIAVSVFIKLFN